MAAADSIAKVASTRGHCADCTELRCPNQAGILDNLCERYHQGLIYTNVSHVLLAINPHRYLENLYGSNVMQQPAATRGPHPYSLAQLALKRLPQGAQAIVVSGESGAGKTETAKIIMRFVESRCASGSNGVLEERVLAMSRVLESLGHAATLHNPTSSRFGKFLSLQLGRGCLSPKITPYLLEASRVVSGPANFHIFYELVAGGENLEEWDLLQVAHQQPRDQLERFRHGRAELADAMARLNLSHFFQPMLQVIAGILHILSYLHDRQQKPAVASESRLERACGLLGLSLPSLKSILTTKQLGVPKDKPILLERTEEQSQGILRSLVVTIYRKLFLSVVDEMNQSFEHGMSADSRELGILDMYGFENLETNRLEQLLINYTNERLQLLFCEQVLVKEQHVYLSEGLLKEEVTLPPEGYGVLQSLDGVLDLLDDWTLTRMRTGGKFSDTSFADAARKGQASARVLRPAVAPGFAVRHFAGEVAYRCHGWLDSNDAKPLPEVLTLLEQMDAWPLRQLEPPRRSQSVSRTHRVDLNSLLTKLKGMQGLHFIRCFRPNKEQSGAWIDRDFLAKQLRGSGVPQLLQIMGEGFPHRVALKEVASSFASCLGTEGCSDRLLTELLMHIFQVPRSEWRLGVSQLFLKAGQLAKIEELAANPPVVDPVRIAAARRTARRLRWRRALHTVTLVGYLAHWLRRRRRRRMKAAFLASIFVFRLKNLRIKRALAVRCHEKVETEQIPTAFEEKVAGRENLETPTTQSKDVLCQNAASADLCKSKAGRKRSRPPATPQEGGVLLEPLRKRRFCT